MKRILPALAAAAVAASPYVKPVHAQALGPADIPPIVALNRSNEIAFKQRYEGRHFFATGYFYHASDSFFLGITIDVLTDGGHVNCSIPHAEQNAAAGWTSATRLEIQGAVSDTFLGELMLTDCSVQDYGASQMPVTPSEPQTRAPIAPEAGAAKAVSGADIQQMVAMNMRDPAGFRRAYGGKRFEDFGSFVDASPAASGAIDVLIAFGASKAICEFSDGFGPTISSWSAQTRFEVEATISETVLGTVLLRNCGLTVVGIGGGDQAKASAQPAVAPEASPRSPPVEERHRFTEVPPERAWPPSLNSPRADLPVEKPAHSSGFGQGFADRTQYQKWRNSLLEGQFRQGALYWEGRRSIPGSRCSRDFTVDFYAGCLADQRMIAPDDRRRLADPEYRAGWNAVPAED